jgi:hypothetical protein
MNNNLLEFTDVSSYKSVQKLIKENGIYFDRVSSQVYRELKITDFYGDVKQQYLDFIILLKSYELLTTEFKLTDFIIDSNRKLKYVEVTNICNKEFIIYDGIEDADGVIYNGVDVRVWDFWDKFIISDKDKTILFFDSLTEDDRQVIIPTLPKISLYSFVKV